MSSAYVPKVLAVDDDREMLRAIKRTLRKESMKLTTVNDPNKALQMLADMAYDLVLSDIEMPQMSGLDLLRKVRTLCPETVRVIVSGVSSIDAAVEAINEGAVHRFVRKPFTPEGLRKTIGEVLDEIRASRSNVSPIEAWCEAAGEIDLGLTTVRRDHAGAYVLDPEHAEARAPELGLEHILRVWNG